MSQPTHRPLLTRTFRLARRAGILTLLATASVLPAQPSEPTFSEVGKEAFQKLRTNDMAGAVALLEPAYRSGQATAVDLGLLGTLYLETGRPSDALAVLQPLTEGETVDAAVLFNAGRAALATGDQASGERFLERSVAMMPISPAARELGLLRGAQNRTAEAFQLLRPWITRNPRDVDARMAAALCALRLERPNEAEALLEGLPAAQPKVAILQGQLHLQKHDPAGAIKIFEPLIANHPPEIANDLFRLAADAYLAAGRAPEAVRLLEGRRNGPRQLQLLAEALYRTGRTEDAVALLAPVASPLIDQDISGAPLMIGIVADYGRMLAAAGRFADAVPVLEKATASAPDISLPWKNLGEALAGSGRRADASAALERFQQLTQQETERRRAAERAAKDPTANALAQAQAAFGTGEHAQALALVRQEAAISPSDIRPRLLEVRILIAMSRLQDALAVADATANAFPGNPDAIYQRGAIRLGLDRRELAEQDFREALSLFPDHVAAMSDLALLLMVRGDRPEARALLERVLELQPDDARAAENLARLQG